MRPGEIESSRPLSPSRAWRCMPPSFFALSAMKLVEIPFIPLARQYAAQKLATVVFPTPGPPTKIIFSALRDPEKYAFTAVLKRFIAEVCSLKEA